MDVTSGTENETGRMAGLVGRRKFLALGGAGGSGAARDCRRCTGVDHRGRFEPVAAQCRAGRIPTRRRSRAHSGGGTTRWDSPLRIGGNRRLGVDASRCPTRPSGPSRGAPPIDPYFPDLLTHPCEHHDLCLLLPQCHGSRPLAGCSTEGAHANLRHRSCTRRLGEELWIELTNLGLHSAPTSSTRTPSTGTGSVRHPVLRRRARDSISVPIGREFTYVYRPDDPGTYMYHCHFEDVEHVTMGMTASCSSARTARHRRPRCGRNNRGLYGDRRR